jgi:hypothetical protein
MITFSTWALIVFVTVSLMTKATVRAKKIAAVDENFELGDESSYEDLPF